MEDVLVGTLMDKIAEIRTSTAKAGDEHEPEEWDEWLVVYQRDGYVTVVNEYISPRTKERKSWEDSGIAIADGHLDEIIEALQRAKALRST